MLLVTLCIQAIFLVCRLVTTLRHDRCVQQTVLPQDFAVAQERREKNGKEKEKSGKKKKEKKDNAMARSLNRNIILAEVGRMEKKRDLGVGSSVWRRTRR